MAAASRALTLKLLADVTNFTKGLDKGTKETETFGNKISAFGKKAGLAFAAAGAAAAIYAGKLLKDGVESAIADEKANALLANTLRNVAGATDETIEKTLAYTRATELATGVTEDELRPSLNRLTIATGDVQKATKLQTLALNVAAGSGKSLEAVSQALAKAQEGNTASLGRLGIGLSAVQLKTMSMEDVTKSLAATFDGASALAANTFEGKMTRLGLAFEDVRDTIGGFVLDAITPLVENVVNKIMPALASFADSIGGKEGLNGAFSVFVDGAKRFFLPIFDGLRVAFNKIKDSVMTNKDEFILLFNFLKNFVAPFFGAAFKLAIEGIATAISLVVDIVAGLIKGFERIIELGRKVGGALGSVGRFITGASMQAPAAPSAPSSGFITPFVPSLPSAATGPRVSFVNQVTVNGAIDAEGTARTIVDVLNRSSARGTLGSAAFV